LFASSPTRELPFTSRLIKTGADNNRQAWIQDPDGNRIELMEMVPGALQFKAIKEMHAVAAVNQ
jgi:hypothetical protein